MKIYYVYILECANGSYYTGITNDIARRLAEHPSGLDKQSYTFSRRPLKLVFVEEFPDPYQAIDIEKKIKGWRREKKKAIIEGKWDILPELSRFYSRKSKKQ